MIAMTLAEIAALVGGALHDTEGHEQVTAPADVDTRRLEPGSLFVALAGERVDGHEYADAAFEAGAVGMLGSRPTGRPTIVVDDPVEALGRLAHEVVGRVDALTVIALTGSQGKTSTKDLLAQVLAGSGPTVATAGNFNNEIGVPLTALRVTEGTRFLVLEMGARGIGHLAYLCQLVRPDIALELNVGKAHLGEFGTQADIATAKGELVEALTSSGTAVLNADDPLVAAMATRTVGRVTTYGESVQADVRIEGLDLDDLGRPTFDLVTPKGRAPVRMKVLGEHNAGNAAAAAAVALRLGLGLEEVASALSLATPSSPWRMELHELDNGVIVINDAYNANPDSMRAALKVLAAIGRARAGSRTVAVLGEMLELGAASMTEHDSVGRLAVRLDINQLVVVGETARPIHLGASLEGSWNEESVFVEDSVGALDWLRENVAAGDVVLVKASRGAALEKVADALVAGANLQKENGR